MSGNQSAYERAQEWWKNRTPEEFELQALAYSFDRHFSDMRLQSARIRRRLLRYLIQDKDGTWSDTESGDGIVPSLEVWVFTYRRSKKWLGLCDSRRNTIYIRPGLNRDIHRGTLLHELIHCYEEQLIPHWREWLLLDLHDRLRKKLGRRVLSRYLDFNSHPEFALSGHGLLFLLKSLELDISFGWKHGTVFGYGRDE